MDLQMRTEQSVCFVRDGVDKARCYSCGEDDVNGCCSGFDDRFLFSDKCCFLGPGKHARIQLSGNYNREDA